MINQLDEIRDTILKYFETRIDIVKIEMRSKIEALLISAVYLAIVLCIFTVFATILTIILAIYLNKKLESDYLGYVIVLGLIIVKLAIWIIFRKQLSEAIRVLILKFVHTKEEITGS